jgi:hypothetical protein
VPYQLALPLLLQQKRFDEAAYCRDHLEALAGNGAPA